MTRTLTTTLTTMVLTTAAALAQQPRLTNGQLQPEAVSGSLDATMRAIASRATEPVWIGYAVPAANPNNQMCCWSDGGTTACNLEPSAPTTLAAPAPASGALRLDSGDLFFVLNRFEKGELNRLRTFSEACPIDAGGRIVHWLTGVSPTESVSLLAAHANGPTRKPADAALAALAQHAAPAALDVVLKLARSGDSTYVRGQALFWLAQRAGQKAVGAITEAIERDPETDVKRRAVFALSHLPKDEGIPLLINVARTNANPAVRKQAIFWLGQSRDPRALKFFEEILFK